MVNVVGIVIVLLSAIPVYLAHRLTTDRDGEGSASASTLPAAAAH